MTVRVAGTALVVLAAFLFGTLGTVSREARSAGVETIAFVTWRAALGALTMVIAVLIASRRPGHALTRPGSVPRRERATLLLSSCVGALTNLALFAAFGRTTVAVVVIVFYAYPVIVTALSVGLFGERLTRLQVGALGIASGGLLLVVVGPLIGSAAISLDPLGIGLAAGAAVLQSTFVLAGGRGYPSVRSSEAALVILVTSTILYLPLLLLLAPGTIGTAMASAALPLVAWAGIAGAASATFSLIAGIRAIGASRASVLMTLEPVVGVAAAAIFLQERPVPVQLVGGAAVLIAGIALQLSPTHRGVPGLPEPRAGEPDPA